MVISEKKHSDTLELPIIKLIEMVEKHKTLITINYLALGFASRSASLMTARSSHDDFA